MAAKYPTSLKDKKYPNFIRNSDVIKEFPRPAKVFPNIGLKNRETPLKSIKLSKYQNAKIYLTRVFYALDDVYSSLGCASFDLVDNLHNDIDNLLSTAGYEGGGYAAIQYDKFIKSSKSGDISITIPKSLTFKHLSIPKDRSFTAVIDQVIAFAKNHKVKLCGLDKIKLNENISAKDLPFKSKNIKLCFSSNGNKGNWDIATMSMRGIKSCMKWTSSHATSLIGSLVDPYTAIIYLTDNKKTYHGKKMLARAVVRFVVDNKNKPCLYMEKVYPDNLDDEHDARIREIFTSFLESKTKLKVVDEYSNVVIPLSKPTQHIYRGCYDDYLSYSDADLSYREVKKFYDPKKISI